MLQISGLLTEYKQAPLGMDEKHPRFCYRLTGDSLYQSARRIVVKNADAADRVVWDSGMVTSPVSIQIPYHGEPLKPFTHYTWQVQVKDENGIESEWSDNASFETGFLGSEWSSSKWISAKNYVMALYPPRCFSSDFTLKRKPVRARLYITALGLYEAYINGKNIAPEDCFMPGHTQYDQRVQYQAYDVLDLLRDDANVISVMVGDGWYKGTIGRWWKKGAITYGDCAKLRAELHFTYADGTTERIGTCKGPWVYNGDHSCDALVMSDIYMGETYDAMAENNNWLDPNIKHVATDDWTSFPYNPVTEHDKVKTKIVWNTGAPVRRVMRMTAKEIIRKPSGTYIVDFGQNLVGREHFVLHSPSAGTSIVIKHGEMLNPDGSLYRANLRSACATTLYTCAGKEHEEYEPHFTFYGFRYLEISGWPCELTAEQLWVEVLSTQLETTGDFSCSEPLLNKLYSNIVWGQRGNFLDVPTDCPQRDERHGWTGDTQVFMNTATYNSFAAPFYDKWIRDLNMAVYNDCIYPIIAPNPFDKPSGEYLESNGSTGWGDAGIICPWVMMAKYGDLRSFTDNLQRIIGYLDWQADHVDADGIAHYACFGDWLNIDAPTDGGVLSTAYMVGMNRLAAKMARMIGNTELAEERETIADAIKANFVRKYFTDNGDLTEKTQTAALLTLHFGLCPNDDARKNLVEWLAKDIRDTHDTHLTTGFLGTPLLLKVLSDNGKTDLAYDLLCQTSYPGWLYPVTQGATTMWERWNSWTQDKGFGDVSMNSFNHYAYGAVAEWFFEYIGGIKPISAPDSFGFRKFKLAPQFGHKFEHAEVSYTSLYGKITSNWKRKDANTVVWSFSVPCNTTANVTTPDGRSWQAQPGSYTVEVKS